MARWVNRWFSEGNASRLWFSEPANKAFATNQLTLLRMPPIDQENHDWTKGNCFYVILESMKDSKELRAIGAIPKDSLVRLVHGILNASEKCIKHAWAEIDGNVVDCSNHRAIQAGVGDCCRDNDAVSRRGFTR